MPGPSSAPPSFYSGFIKLFSGLIVVQVLNFVFSLILPKYYSPSDYALFGIFSSVAYILMEIISLKLEVAVFLPADDEEATEIVHAIFLISLLVLPLLLLVSGICWYLYGPVFILLPGLMLIYGFIQGLHAWFTRAKDYRTLNIYRLMQAIFTPGLSLLFIIAFGWEFGMIAGFVLGQFAGLLYLLLVYDRVEVRLMNFALLKKYLVRYQKFPKYGVISSLINSISRNSLLFFIERAFGAVQAGYYTLSSRILNTPAGMYQNSLGQVYMVQARTLQGAALKAYTKSAVRFGFLLGVLPALAVLLFGQPLFALLFGDTWTEAGKMSQYIVLWLFTSAIINPVGFLVDLRLKLRYEFGWNISLLLLRILCMGVGYFLDDLYLSLFLFCGISVLMNLYLYWYVLKLTDEPQ